jgi:hypothetical protein
MQISKLLEIRSTVSTDVSALVELPKYLRFCHRKRAVSVAHSSEWRLRNAKQKLGAPGLLPFLGLIGVTDAHGKGARELAAGQRSRYL